MVQFVMRIFKKLVLAASEIGILAVGLIASIEIGVVQFSQDILGAWFLLGGFVLTGVTLFWYRRQIRSWKIQDEALAYMASKAELELHPVRFRRKRKALRSLLWMPSLVAAPFLFFLPVASHLRKPSSHFMNSYHVPIPWTASIVPLPEDRGVMALTVSQGVGRFGLTPFWDWSQPFSIVSFVSIPADSTAFECNHAKREEWRKRGQRVTSREFRMGRRALTCWQYHLRSTYEEYPLIEPFRDSGFWEIA